MMIYYLGIIIHISWGSLKVKALVAQVTSNFCDPLDCSLPGSSLHGILQARKLEWAAISFLQEYWSALPCPPPGIFPTRGSNPGLYTVVELFTV